MTNTLTKQKIVPVHIFDFFDVIGLATMEEKIKAMDKINPGYYSEYDHLRNGINKKEIPETKENLTKLKAMKKELDPMVEEALVKGYFVPRQNTELLPGLESAYKQGIVTVIYSTTPQEVTSAQIKRMGLSELIGGYISPNILTSAGKGEARKLPHHFAEIKDRLAAGEVGGIIKNIGNATLFVDDRAAYAGSASAVGIKGYQYNPKSPEIKEASETVDIGKITKKDADPFIASITIVPNLIDIYKLENIL